MAGASASANTQLALDTWMGLSTRRGEIPRLSDAGFTTSPLAMRSSTSDFNEIESKYSASFALAPSHRSCVTEGSLTLAGSLSRPRAPALPGSSTAEMMSASVIESESRAST